MNLTNAQLDAARATVREFVPATPQFAWPLLQQRLGMKVWVKHENHTPAGAFKVRGGMTYFEQLVRNQPRLRGVIAVVLKLALFDGHFGFVLPHRLEGDLNLSEQRRIKLPVHADAPRERHRGFALVVSHGQREGASLLVPDSMLEDAGLSFQPASLRQGDVGRVRSEHVEDKAPVPMEEPVRGGEDGSPILVGVHVEQRAERTDHERDLLVDRWLA